MFECTKCEESKPATAFYYKRDGYRIKQCKACKNALRVSYDLLGSMLWNSKSRASKAGRDFELTREDILRMKDEQGNKCALTGWELDWEPAYNGKRNAPFNRVSIDRIDSSGGYTKDNVQLVCDGANRIKSNYPQETFIAMCKAIAEKHSSC